MAKIDKTYQQLLKDILSRGYEYNDPNRKGVKRKQLSDYRIKHDLIRDGFPILTLRKLHLDGGIGEFVSFMRGENNLVDLYKNKVNFWFKDGYNFCKEKISFDSYVERIKNGDRKIGSLGKIYPWSMRNWNGEIDQIKNLVKTLKENPMATKKTVTMWNPSEMKDMALSPCHWSFEVLSEPLTLKQREEFFEGIDNEAFKSYKTEVPYKERENSLNDIGIPKYGLSIKWHQHSVDVYLGLPTNIIYYSLMCIALSTEVGVLQLSVIGDLSNVHLYDNAYKASYELLKRDPNKYNAPYFKYNGRLDDLKNSSFTIDEYDSYENIKVEMLAYAK